jgi:hypothetical protein
MGETMTTFTKPEVAVVKETVPRTTQSPYPFRVFSYQFKELEDARKFAKDLLATPRTCREAKVEMFHRSVEVRRTVTDEKGKSESVTQTVLLDVTADSPEEAEAKWVGP